MRVRQRRDVRVLACIAIGVLWALSYLHPAASCVSVDYSAMAVKFESGTIEIYWVKKWPWVPMESDWYKTVLPTSGTLVHWVRDLPDHGMQPHLLGFSCEAGTELYDGGVGEDAQEGGWTETGTPFFAASVPYWSFMATAILFIWMRSRRQQSQPETCRSCGYNLTGNTSGVCPECGTAIQGKTGNVV